MATCEVDAASSSTESEQPVAAVIQQFGRPHLARHQHGIARNILKRFVAGKVAQQSPRKIVEVVGPFAHHRVAGTDDADAHFVLHAFHRRFGREPGAHGIAHALAPSLIVRKQAIGFDHLAAFACQIQFARIQHSIDGVAQTADGLFQTDQLVLHVVGDHALDLDARLVQDDAADRDAFGQAFAAEFARPVAA